MVHHAAARLCLFILEGNKPNTEVEALCYQTQSMRDEVKQRKRWPETNMLTHTHRLRCSHMLTHTVTHTVTHTC